MVSGFDPILIRDHFSLMVNSNIFETLVSLENVDVKPILAEYWYQRNDSLFVVKFREDVLFSDGDLMTGDDILASLNRALRHPKSISNIIRGITSFEISETNILYIHNYYSISILDFLSRAPIFKASIIEHNDDEFINDNPIGTGEYFLYSLDYGRAYFRKNRFHRNFRSIRNSPDVVRLIHEPSQEIRYQMFIDNEVDLLLQVPPSAYDDVFTNPNIQVIENVGNSMLLMVFDVTRDVTPGINLPVNPLKDKRVRNAIAHSLDVRRFISEDLYGLGVLTVIPTFPHLLGYPDHLEYYEYDIDLSRSLMAEAGFEKGFDMAITVRDDYLSFKLVDFIKNSLKAININVIIESYLLTEFLERLRDDPPSAVIVNKRLVQGFTDITFSLMITYHPIGPFNPNRNIHPRINTLFDSLRSLNRLDPQWFGVAYRLTDLVYDELFVIPFFQNIEILVHCNSFSFDFSENFLFSDFKRVRRR